MNEHVRASGGLVFRRSSRGWEVLAVHRPRYDDWSLPKGKDDPGESPQEAALREVWEETGVKARILAPLDEVRYRLADGRMKVVRYFAMQPVSRPSAPPGAFAPDAFTPNDEVDEVAWVSPASAAELLTYGHDVDLVAGADLDALVRTGVLHLVRHGSAGARSQWVGDDRLRPLSKKGIRQAEAIAAALADAPVTRILSSPYVRCVETVAPLAELTGLDVGLSEALAEGSPPEAVAALVESLGGENAVLCSHGDVIPDLLDRFRRCGLDLGEAFECRKASVWTIRSEAGTWVSADYLPPAES